MKNPLLRQVLRMTKYAFIGVFLQCFLSTLLLATEIRAQKKSINEIFLSVSFENQNLEEAFLRIGEKTNFNFHYNQKIASSKKINLSMRNTSLGDLLRQISKDTGLSFNRINETIHVDVPNEAKGEVTEELQPNLLISITGKVVSVEDNEGIPGVNVIVKGTTTGTVTDANGNYKIEVPSEETILVYSSIGYLKQEITVGNQTQINISLNPDITKLDELVFVGYGLQKKSDLTGAIANVKIEEKFEQLPNVSIIQSLQGNIPGLNVGPVNAAGQEPSLSVRGNNT